MGEILGLDKDDYDILDFREKLRICRRVLRCEGVKKDTRLLSLLEE